MRRKQSGRSLSATLLLVVMALLAFGAAMTQPPGRPREVMP